MGKGDKRSRRGKIINKSFGNARPKSKNRANKPTAPKKEEAPVQEPVAEATAPVEEAPAAEKTEE